MNITFSHGIYQANDNFLDIVDNEIVLVNAPVQFQCCFRHGQNIYFYKCSQNMDIMDTSYLDNDVLYYIFMFLDVKTSSPYFELLTNDFVISDVFPEDVDMFFHEKYKVMYKKVNDSWQEVICLRLGTYFNNTINQQTVGSQIYEDFTTGEYINVGQILKDDNGPIFKNIECYTLNSNFLTSVDTINYKSDYPNYISKNYKMYNFVAAEFLPKYRAVKFNISGQLILCSSDNYNEEAIFVTIQEASQGEKCNVIRNGIIKDDILNLQFNDEVSLYMGVDGDITSLLDLTKNSIQKLGKLIGTNTILIQMENSINV